MRAVFKELVSFETHRREYLSDDAFQALQLLLMANPHAGPVIQGTGGLRKLRWSDPDRGKGKRGVCGLSITGLAKARSSGSSRSMARMSSTI